MSLMQNTLFLELLGEIQFWAYHFYTVLFYCLKNVRMCIYKCTLIRKIFSGSIRHFPDTTLGDYYFLAK